MAEQKSLRSPRIVALEERLVSGEATALADFWREVGEQGTPLIEPDEESEQHRLVTFLWRAQGEETQNVVLRSGPAGWEDPTPHQLARLGETDLWHKTYRLRATTRTTYVLAPNYVFDRDRRKSTDFGTKLLADPLNPRQFIYTKDEEIPDDQETVVSLLELPEAPAQPWSVLRPEVAAGEVRMERQRSELLGNERRVWYYTPAGYDPQRAKPYGLLVLFDGPAYQDLIPTPRILDNLIAAGKIEPIVAVFIDSLNGETRSRELPCHQPFVAFLTQELLPHVRENYHITCDPARTVVAGSSYGGLAAAFVGLRAPEVFGNVLSQSGSFWWDYEPDGGSPQEWLTEQFVASARVPVRFYLDVGLLELIWSGSMITSNRHLRDILRLKGYEVTYAEFDGGHDYVCWNGTLVDGLLALLGEDIEVDA